MGKREGTDYWDSRESPDTIMRPDEYPGGASLAVFCTQTALSATEQRRLVDDWCTVLPTLDAVTHVWFHSKVPQRLFDAACRMPKLSGLWIKWSAIEDLEALAGTKHLRAMHLGSSTRIRSIAPLASVAKLECLTLENLKLICDLSPLALLPRLRELGAQGAFPDTAWEVESIAPIGELTSLQSLTMGMLRPKNASLRPLAGLKNLRFLGLDNRLPMPEYAWLSRRLPHTQCMRFAPHSPVGDAWGIKCRQCKASKDMVLITGKGGPHLCTKCDAAKVAAYVAAFEQAAH